MSAGIEIVIATTATEAYNRSHFLLCTPETAMLPETQMETESVVEHH
jgi:hypothetical protein